MHEFGKGYFFRSLLADYSLLIPGALGIWDLAGFQRAVSPLPGRELIVLSIYTILSEIHRHCARFRTYTDLTTRLKFKKSLRAKRGKSYRGPRLPHLR